MKIRIKIKNKTKGGLFKEGRRKEDGDKKYQILDLQVPPTRSEISQSQKN